MPASNMKIVTLAAAAERLGWDYTFETRAYATGSIAGGVLQGDLVAVGSGDPSLAIGDGSAGRLFDEWADRLKQLGVGAISGRIVGDDNAFEDETLGFGWSWDDLPDDYAAGVGALQLNENAVRVTVTPGPTAGDQAGITVDPPDSGLVVENRVATGASGSSTTIVTRRLPGNARLEVAGSIPVGSSPTSRVVSVDNPTLFFARALRRALIARGIDVRGEAVDADDIPGWRSPTGSPMLHQSPPLSTLAVRLMKESQNQYAETFLKALSAGTPATAVSGRAEAQKIFSTWGIGTDGLIQRDGSGLSRYNYVTADALVTILSHVYRDARLRGPFEASLPIAGRDGSLANRMKGTAAEGNVRAKTGSMSNVRTLSGYATSADGEPLVFSILANNFETPADVVIGATDSIVVRLVRFQR